MQPSYIPSKDADFAVWLANFAALIAATPTDYGLVTGDATIISASDAAFQAAYLLATNPSTRTAPTIADKDAERASATATVQPYAVRISRNMGVSDLLKLGVGVNLPNFTRTPIPPPTTVPVLALVNSNPGTATLGYADTSTPMSKAKPPGATGLDLRVSYGTAVAVDPDAALPLIVGTKSPLLVPFPVAQVGKIATLWGRWQTRSGPGGIAQYGPWSTSLSTIVT